MKVLNLTELILNLKHWLDSVVDEKVKIKREHKKDLIIITLEEYNSLVETNYLLSGKNREVIQKSLEEVKQGKLISRNLLD